MAIDGRIRFFRNLHSMTQKYLGLPVGLPEKSADVHLVQYETGTRNPQADILDVSPLALSIPDIDSYIGLIHTLFIPEDRYRLTIDALHLTANCYYAQSKRDHTGLID